MFNQPPKKYGKIKNGENYSGKYEVRGKKDEVNTTIKKIDYSFNFLP